MLFLVLLLFPFSLLCGSIVKINSLSETKSIFENITNQDLIVFDIDSTLIIPKDLALRPCGTSFFLKQFTELAKEVSESRLRYLISQILRERKLELLEPNSLELIRSLQKNAKVIAITTLKTGRYGSIDSIENWRLIELSAMGYDFSTSRFSCNHIVFGDLINEGALPIFKGGVLFTAGLAKGEMLTEFLHRVKWTPKRIIIIDDVLEHLINIEDLMAGLHLECLCFHYQPHHILNEKINETIAERQFYYLQVHDCWLGDDAALQSGGKQFKNEHD